MVQIVPVQCWLARAALRWTATDLARVAEVARKTVRRFERGEPLKSSTVEMIQRALEKAGVLLVGVDDGGPGVRLRGSVESSNEYHVVVTLRGLSWEWEIYRDGKPLPVPLRDGFYRSKSAAGAADYWAVRPPMALLLPVRPRDHGTCPWQLIDRLHHLRRGAKGSGGGGPMVTPTATVGPLEALQGNHWPPAHIATVSTTGPCCRPPASHASGTHCGRRRPKCFALRDILFDHLVGEREQRGRHIDGECFGSLEIDHQREPCR
jgi:transcriptional regulator with XRE-family HTH domain